MPEKLLIVNADDFGFTEGINEGIIRAYNEGVVTSTSAMTEGETASGVTALERYPDLSVGLHFQVGDKTLENRIRSGERLSPKEVSQLQQDFEGQVRQFAELTGSAPSHIDSHYSVHMHPDVKPFVGRYCEENQIPCRQIDANLTKDFFGRDSAGHSDPQRVSVEALLAIIDSLEDGVTELMCHPSEVDAELSRVTGYVSERAIELATLTDTRVAERLDQSGVALISWTDSRVSVRTPDQARGGLRPADE